MASITLNLDERSIKNGMAQVRIRISHRGSNCFIGTGVYIEPQYFQPSSIYDPVHRKAQMAIEKRERIVEQIHALDDYLISVSADDLASMSANDIRERAGMNAPKREAVVQHTTKAKNSGDFLLWYDEYGDTRRAVKTQSSYAYGGKVLREYCASLGLKTISFCDIDYARLADYSRWLEHTGRSAATRHMLESYVRAAYKEAQKRHLVSRENDPYYDYSIKPVPLKDIECLSVAEMRTLMTVELSTRGLQRARDLALMSFYLCGANLIDLYEMPKSKRNEVEFIRHKVEGRYQRALHIRIEPELRALIDVYGGDDRLLCFKSAYANYESFRHKIGHRLREISDIVGFDVSMAKIRRTWATIAGDLDVPADVIDKSMGHVDKTINTRHYQEYKWYKTADANRKVLDAIVKKNDPPSVDRSLLI